MPKTTWFIIGVVVILLVVSGYFGYKYVRPYDTGGVIQTPFVSENVVVTSPLPKQVVESPLEIVGQAKGTWFFEASFPVLMMDANGKVIGTGYAQARDEWMTTDFVPFRSVLMFTPPETETGTLVLQKDNPSGLPEFDDSVSFPIRFK